MKTSRITGIGLVVSLVVTNNYYEKAICKSENIFFNVVKIAELASQGFQVFGRTRIVIRSQIAAL